MKRRPARRRHPATSAEADRRAIGALRDRIDALDAQLVSLLNERAACALQIGELKDRLGLELYQPERESEVVRHVREVNRGPLAADAIARLFERIIDEARRLERQAQSRARRTDGTWEESSHGRGDGGARDGRADPCGDRQTGRDEV